MPYAEGRIYNDADSHIMETPDWLVGYADPHIRGRLAPLRIHATGRMAEASCANIGMVTASFG